MHIFISQPNHLSSVEKELTSIIATNSTKSNTICSKQITLSEQAMSHFENDIQSICLSSSQLNTKETEVNDNKIKKIKHGSNMDVIN